MPEQPKLLDLTKDREFKIFFSSNEQVLKSFLKSFLPIPDNISDVVILNPEDRNEENERTSAKQNKPSDTASVQPTNTLHIEPTSILPKTRDKKQTVLDLRIRLGSGENINVEMQAVSRKYFLQRILFYWAKLYSQDLKKGEGYDRVAPAYSLIFTTFLLWGKRLKNIVNSFSIRSDQYPHIRFSEYLCIITAELNKLPKDYKNLLDLREQWCYFLIHSSTLTEAECKYLSQNKELKMTIEHLKKLSEDEKLYQKRLSEEISLIAWDWDRQGLLEEGEAKGEAKGRSEGEAKGLAKGEAKGLAKGLAKGEAKGLAKGEAKGLAKGRAEGRKEERLAMAKQMLKKGFPLSTISELTGLSAADIDQLKL